MADSRQPVLMVFHAHPDDESSQTGGTLARYAALGYRTVLVTCTDGSLGDGPDGVKPGQPGHDPRAVAERRSRELGQAAVTLGITDLVELAYADSGPADGAAAGNDASPGPAPARVPFSRLPLDELVAKALDLIRAYQPDVVITYPADGVSGHPDHIRTHEVVAAAHRDLVAAAGSRPAPRLYFIAISKSQLKAVSQGAQASLPDGAQLPPEEMGIDDALVTTAIDVRAYWDEKLRALAAHASQADAVMLSGLFTAAGPAVAGVEEYVRAYPAAGPASPRSVETDLSGGAG
jgi:LmbE family N-acetylglucosaminyl deacetylase